MLPETVVTPDGASILGGGSEMLAEQLAALEVDLQNLHVRVRDRFVAGPPSEGDWQLFQSAGLVPPDELRVWFNWVNGEVWAPAAGEILPDYHPLSLADAVREMTPPEDDPDDLESWAYAPGWLPLHKDYSALAVYCGAERSPSDPALVRQADPEHPLSDNRSGFQTVSLCTFVVWMREAIANGIVRRNSDETWCATRTDLPAVQRDHGFMSVVDH